MAGILNAELAFPQFPALDQYGPNTTLLLHGDGTNGAQNNTFLDSSTNNFTITRNGNTTQGTFSPFSQPNGYWSNYFDGSNYFSISDGGGLNLGTSDFNVEAWVYYTASSSYTFVLGKSNTSNNGWFLEFSASRGLFFYDSDSSFLIYSYTPALNTWYHLAASRSSGTLRIYINGNQVGSKASSTNITSSDLFTIAADKNSNSKVNGYVCNARVVIGSAIYTGSSYTVPTSPLTAVTNTKLLTCQSNRFVDNSTNAYTLTPSGTPSVQGFRPFSAPTSYFPAVNGGGGYFDGSGDYLQTPSNSNVSAWSTDFTIECWVYPISISSSPGLWTNSTSNSDGYTFGYVYSNGAIGMGRVGINEIASAAGVIGINRWYHVAFVRNGSATNIYVNGVSVASGGTTVLETTTTKPLTIAGNFQSGGAQWNGYISDFRVVKGTAVYTSNFTPPTAPLTAITNTQLLASFTNAGIIDSVSQNALETVGNAQISTTQSKFGGASMYFDGTGDWLLLNNSPIPSTGDFTVELWFWSSTATTTFQGLFGFLGNSSGYAVTVGLGTTSATGASGVFLNVATGSSSWGINANSPTGITSNSAWYHLALVRSGGTITVYVNGNAVITSTAIASTTALGGGTINRVGALTNDYPLNGYIDDLRVTRGIARYTQNFTPPKNAYPDYGPLTNIPTVDPNFKNTTLLLHGNGTNGAQNNTFLDSSTNNFTITRNGNTTQGTFTPFSQPDGWWSNYLNGSSDYLSVPYNSAFDFGTGDFTIEAWIYLTSGPASGNCILGSIATNGTDFQFRSSTTLALGSNANTWRFTSNSTTFPTNQWIHIAVSRVSGTAYMWLNGQSIGSGSETTSFNAQSAAVLVGRSSDGYFPGYISNLRVIKGTGLYTSNFTPSTTPLTAITNTSLLTCQSNYFKDNSTNAFTITPSGTPTVQNFYPFFPPLDYSTAAIGGSAYFDGSGDYLSAGSNAAFAFGTGAYTVEMWVNPNSINQQVYLFNDTTGGIGFYFETSGSAGFTIAPRATGSPLVTGGYSSLQANAWNHVVFCRASTSSNQTSIFVNGTRVANGTDNTNWTVNGPCLVGGLAAGIYMFAGQMSQVRVVKGTDVYGYSNTSITVPTTPLTAITNTSLLLSCTNGGIFDNASKNDIETVGSAQISTTQSKFGGSSMYFDASGSYLSCPSSPNVAFGTGDFTVEYWMYSNDVSSSTQKGMFQTSDTAGGLKTTYTTGIFMGQGYTGSGNLDGAIRANINGTNVGSSVAVLTTGAWYHVALVRASGVVTIYVNGNSVASATISGSITGTYLAVGGYYSTSYTFNGYIDDFRITAGIARYRYNFTPPAAPFPNK